MKEVGNSPWKIPMSCRNSQYRSGLRIWFSKRNGVMGL